MSDMVKESKDKRKSDAITRVAEAVAEAFMDPDGWKGQNIVTTLASAAHWMTEMGQEYNVPRALLHVGDRIADLAQAHAGRIIAPEKEWLKLGTGVVRISEIAAVTQMSDTIEGRISPRRRGFVVTLKSGSLIECPEALWDDALLTIMAAEVLS